MVAAAAAPDGPRGGWLTGNMREFNRDTLGFVERCARLHGDIVRTRFLYVPAYFPFSGGPRACVGHAFAMMEAVLVLATVARRFKLRLAPGRRVELLPAMSLRPRDGLRVSVESR